MKMLMLAGFAVLAMSAQAQEKFEVKFATFTPPQHFMSKWLMAWAERLEKASDGRLAFKHFQGAQMAPAPQHYDLARSGRAEITWFLHGGTPGRFPLTEMISLPYMVGSAEIGTKTLNDHVLRSKYLDAEHRGVKLLLLFTHQPGNVHTTKKPIRSLEDFNGMRLRFSSPPVRDFIAALGGTPVGVQPLEQLDMLRKGAIDGVFIDYGGAGTAFKMAGTIRYSTEMYSYVTSFGIAMNPAFYGGLPANLQQLINSSMTNVESEVGAGWDALDTVGKSLLIHGGAEPIRLSREQDAQLRRIGQQVHEAKLKELDEKKLPGREVHRMMNALAQKHAKTSRSFWR